MKVNYSYLKDQFNNPDNIIQKIRQLVKAGDFTLGPKVEKFETEFAKLQKVKYAVGVSSGTDGLLLILKALDISPGDEVITAPNSFYATAAAINLSGAKIVFADVKDNYNIDPKEIKKAITKCTKALILVHLTGNPADMHEIAKIAKRHKLYVIEDAAQAVGAEINGKTVGNFGVAASFSLHPLKNFNVWGDGGFVTTNSKSIAKKIKLLRNHGLKNRNECILWGYNSRLQPIQAVVGLSLLPSLKSIIRARIEISEKYDKLLADLPQVIIPPRVKGIKQVFHTYVVCCQQRDKLYEYLLKLGVEVKIHYPIPLHLQKAARHLGYKRGDFPVTERQARNMLSLPIHQFLSENQVLYVVKNIKDFYKKS